jgi:hypothetical protein
MNQSPDITFKKQLKGCSPNRTPKEIKMSRKIYAKRRFVVNESMQKSTLWHPLGTNIDQQASCGFRRSARVINL